MLKRITLNERFKMLRSSQVLGRKVCVIWLGLRSLWWRYWDTPQVKWGVTAPRTQRWAGSFRPWSTRRGGTVGCVRPGDGYDKVAPPSRCPAPRTPSAHRPRRSCSDASASSPSGCQSPGTPVSVRRTGGRLSGRSFHLHRNGTHKHTHTMTLDRCTEQSASFIKVVHLLGQRRGGFSFFPHSLIFHSESLATPPSLLFLHLCSTNLDGVHFSSQPQVASSPFLCPLHQRSLSSSLFPLLFKTHFSISVHFPHHLSLFSHFFPLLVPVLSFSLLMSFLS